MANLELLVVVDLELLVVDDLVVLVVVVVYMWPCYDHPYSNDYT